MMAVELTSGSIEKLCNGILISQPIVQLLGYEMVQTENNDSNYRLVLSDGLHMNSYFFLSLQLKNLVVENQIKYGTILKIDEYEFMDGENVTEHSPRWIIFIQKITVLIHRDVFGNPLPLMNIGKRSLLVNLNSTSSPCRKFYSIGQLEESLINIQDLNNLPNGNCAFILKLTVDKKFPINTYIRCKVLNINMIDSMGMLVRVSAFNSLADKMNVVFEEKKSYYITDAFLKHNTLNELKLQSNSVIIECLQTTALQNINSNKESNFIDLLERNLNTFCDLIGVCIDVKDIEVCCNSTTRTETAKREISLIDMSMATVTLKVWGENVNLFDEKFDGPPIVMVKQAVLKQFKGAKFFSMLKSSVLLINPSTLEATKLRQWECHGLVMNTFLDSFNTSKIYSKDLQLFINWWLERTESTDDYFCLPTFRRKY